MEKDFKLDLNQNVQDADYTDFQCVIKSNPNSPPISPNFNFNLIQQQQQQGQQQDQKDQPNFNLKDAWDKTKRLITSPQNQVLDFNLSPNNKNEKNEKNERNTNEGQIKNEFDNQNFKFQDLYPEKKQEKQEKRELKEKDQKQEIYSENDWQDFQASFNPKLVLDQINRDKEKEQEREIKPILNRQYRYQDQAKLTYKNNENNLYSNENENNFTSKNTHENENNNTIKMEEYSYEKLATSCFPLCFEILESNSFQQSLKQHQEIIDFLQSRKAFYDQRLKKEITHFETIHFDFDSLNDSIKEQEKKQEKNYDVRRIEIELSRNKKSFKFLKREFALLIDLFQEQNLFRPRFENTYNLHLWSHYFNILRGNQFDLQDFLNQHLLLLNNQKNKNQNEFQFVLQNDLQSQNEVKEKNENEEAIEKIEAQKEMNRLLINEIVDWWSEHSKLYDHRIQMFTDNLNSNKSNKSNLNKKINDIKSFLSSSLDLSRLLS